MAEEFNNGTNYDQGKMPDKTANILAYITIVGFIIAIIKGDKEKCKFHLNQALVIHVFSIGLGTMGNIPIVRIVAGVCSIFIFICWIIGLVAACNGQEKKVPLLGDIHIL